MKTSALLLVAFLLSTRLFSQDTLYTTEGNVIQGKVTEITKDDIKYKKASNPDGPIYIISKSDVVVIEYKNGVKDVFSKPSGNNEINNQSQANNNTNYPQSGNPVYINPRPAVNIVVGAAPFFGYRPWGWGWGHNYYSRPYYGGGYRNYGYHGGYGGGHYGGGGGHYGHHR